MFSDFTRLKSNDDFDTWYSAYVEPGRRYLKTCYEGYQYARLNSADRVALVSLESLCTDVRASCERVFKHVGIEFDTQYFLLRNKKASRHAPRSSTRII